MPDDPDNGREVHAAPPPERGELRFTAPEPVEPERPLPTAVLVSGSGTTLQNFVNERERGRLGVDLRVVISSRKDAYALRRARNAGIPARAILPRDFPGTAAFSQAVLAACEEAGARLICMAGFLHLIEIPPRWLGSILNIHPALLPAFGGKGMYGDRVHKAVIDYGCRLSGCTVHVADHEYDHGPIIIQRAVPVLRDDTVDILRARVFHEECLAYPQALRLFAEGRIAFEGRRALLGPPRRE